MNQSPVIELRIFTGIHAGARAALAPGRFVLGAAPACDLILCDPGVGQRHAELRHDDSGWSLFPLETDAGIPVGGVRLAPGVGVSIGSVLIALEAANVPWQMPSAVATTPAPVSAPAVTALPAESRQTESGQPVKEAVRPRRQFAWLFVPGAAVLAVLLAIGLALMPVDEAPLPLPAVQQTDALVQALAVVQRLEMTQRAQVEQGADGRILVSAMLLDDAEYEKLAEALAQLNPRPALKVSSEQALIESVHEALRARSSDLAAEYLGAGRFRLKGRVSSDAEGETLLQALAAELPAVRAFESDLLSADRLSAQLLDELREQGGAALHGQWQDDVFVVSARVAHHEQLQWEQALLRIDERYGRLIRFAVRTDWQGGGSEDLPFRIQSIVGGAMPYVVLTDGRKILPGGRVKGWRLAGIDGSQVVFDEPRHVQVRR